MSGQQHPKGHQKCAQVSGIQKWRQLVQQAFCMPQREEPVSQVRRCYGLHVSPTFTGSVLTAAPQNVTVFGDRVFKEVSMLSKGQSGGSSANKTGVLTSRGGQDTDVCRGTAVWGCRETMASYMPRRQSSKETSSARNLIWDCQPPELWENNFLQFMVLCYRGCRKLIPSWR